MMTDFLFLRVQNLENTVCTFGVTADTELWQASEASCLLAW